MCLMCAHTQKYGPKVLSLKRSHIPSSKKTKNQRTLFFPVGKNFRTDFEKKHKSSIFRPYDLVTLCTHIKHIALGTPQAIAKLKIFHFSGKIWCEHCFFCAYKVPDLCACLDDFTVEWHVLTQQKLVSAAATTEFWAPTRRRRIRRCLFPFELPWRSGRLSTNMFCRFI